MTDAEIIQEMQVKIGKLQDEVAQLRSEAVAMKFNMKLQQDGIESLAKRSGDLERAAQHVATQATELCRQLRGGSMEHLRTAP